MMIGERNHSNHTIHVPPWPAAFHDLTAAEGGNADDCAFSMTALQRYLPSNLNPSPTDFLLEEFDPENDDVSGDLLPLVDAYSCDNFRMFEFKVRKCMRGRSHDWTECPYAHPGEKARRRDPRKYLYSGTACPDFRKGGCKKGDACEFAHGVFECWLHPARYRTQPCKDGLNCRRRVCFFAHSPDQLRVLSPRGDSLDGGGGSPRSAWSFSKKLQFMSSPESGSPPSESPPMSPMTPSGPMSPLSRSLGSSHNEIMASFRHQQLSKAQAQVQAQAHGAWSLHVGSGSGLSSPRIAMTRPGHCSLPSTPTRMVNRAGMGYFDLCEEEPVMERVESGRDLRAKVFQKLSMENPLDRVDPDPSYDAPNPDLGWVAELIK